MPDDFDHAFLELESDATAIASFVTTENAKTAAVLMGDDFAAEVTAIRAILEDPRRVATVARRGAFLYTYRHTGDHPRGLWLRLPEGVPPTADADWEVVFDLDAYCAQTGGDWHWRGAETLWADPARVLIRLSDGGSDRAVQREYDCAAKAFVPGGFDMPAERGGMIWRDADTVIWTTAEGAGAATTASWPRVVKRLSRGMALADAPVIFEGSKDDVTAGGYVFRDRKGRIFEGFARIREINMYSITLRRDGKGDITLPTPGDTPVFHNATHFAYLAAQAGDHAPGTLVIAPIDGGGERILFAPTPRSAVLADSIMLLDDWMLWVAHDNLVQKLWVLDLTRPDAVPQNLTLPTGGQTIGVSLLDAQPMAGDETLMLHVQGMIQAPAIWTFDLRHGVDGVRFQPLIQQPQSFDAAGMAVQLLQATSEDGTKVPYHLALPRGHQGNAGRIPVLVAGYGGFGVTSDPHYDAVLGALWLARGGALAIAHIRGGGEFGPDWHFQAKGAGRPRAFADFAAVAGDLARRGISQPARIACHGGSNGGLLCGVMLTRYGERFGAVWGSVGVYDMLRFHLFPAGQAWMDEYGDPRDAAARAWLQDYSPLHNVTSRPLPPALIDTAAHDDRVDPSHSRRFVAALQAAGHRPFYAEHGGGHGGGGRSDARAREIALGLAFLRHTIAAKAPRP